MDINELNDFELGVVKGVLAANNGENELEVLEDEQNIDAKRGIRYGFKKALKRTFKDSVLNFRTALVAYHKEKSSENKYNLLDACKAIKDELESDDDGLELYGVDGEFKVVKRYSKSNLDEVNKLLEDDPTKEIVAEEDDDVLVGDKVSDSAYIADAEEAEYTLNKVNNNKYEVLKNGVPTYELTKKQTNWQCTCPGFKHRGKCKHIGMLQDVLPKRHPRKELEAYVPEIKSMFEPVFGPMYNESTGEGKWAIVGSFRRNVSTFKDIDIIIECPKEEFERKVLDILEQDPNYENIMHGSDIVRGYYHGWYFDVSRVQPGEWGSYLLYRTGSADFNMKMRGLAKKLGYGLSEHGLFKRDTGEVIAKDSEQDIFNALGLKYVEPENRI